jgi:hypothetical protein
MEFILLIVTLISLTVAIVATALAWRVIQQERLRSEARIAALVADIADERTVNAADPESTAVAEIPFRDAPAATPVMFGARQPAGSGFRMVAVVGVGALVVAAVIAGVMMTSGGRQPRPASTAAAMPPASTDVVLELVALGHEREADRLTVRGVIRTPPASSDVNHLTAVVLLFTREGGFIGSGRAEVDARVTAPGAERTFVVTVPASDEVGRYRVSFRSDDQVIPHVDRRSGRSGA